MSKNIHDFDKFDIIVSSYGHCTPEKENLFADQIVTVLFVILYGWYMNNLVFIVNCLAGEYDELECNMCNWLYRYYPESRDIFQKYILHTKENIRSSDYEDMLYELCMTLDEDYLQSLSDIPAKETIYKCDGPFTQKKQHESLPLAETEVNIKPCPFCGSNNLELKSSWTKYDNYLVYVKCATCKAEAGFTTTLDDPEKSDWDNDACIAAIERWNSRK